MRCTWEVPWAALGFGALPCSLPYVKALLFHHAKVLTRFASLAPSRKLTLIKEPVIHLWKFWTVIESLRQKNIS